ncbi:MAG: histidine--tRNA ligase [Candidatus Thermoplasmatota archaeon]|nr:histidine--tRNA ligase [Candidatus Thermoplasmatota archaeon]
MFDLSRPRGTRDFSPNDMASRRRIEEEFRKLLTSYGYGEVQTPAFEHADLFIARSGPQVIDQLYDFKDKGGRHMALRPELTAPVMRYYSTELKSMPKPLRVFYFGNCFRYERPQRGRFREFWQLGIEYIGRRTPLACSEVISISMEAMERAKINDHRVRIGHIGIVRSLLGTIGIDTENYRDLMIAIDKKDKIAMERIMCDEVEDAHEITSLLTTLVPKDHAPKTLSDMSIDHPDLKDAIDHLRSILHLLDDQQGRVHFDPSITRGLDYYEGMVFEIDIPSLGAEKQVCGGGEYSLSNILGSEVEGIGFGIGFDRVMMAIADSERDALPTGGFYIIPLGESANVMARHVQRDLTAAGHRCIMEAQGRGLKKALSIATSMGARYAVIIGEEEVGSGEFSLKDLVTGDQRRIAFKGLSKLEGVFHDQ